MSQKNTEFLLGLEDEDTGEVAEIKAIPAAPAEKRYRLVIEEEENALNYVPVGVNGTVYQIMRGIEVEVPQSVLDVLEQARAARPTQERQQDGSGGRAPCRGQVHQGRLDDRRSPAVESDGAAGVPGDQSRRREGGGGRRTQGVGSRCGLGRDDRISA